MHFELTDRIKAVSAFPDLSGSFPEYSVTITDGKSQNCVNRTNDKSQIYFNLWIWSSDVPPYND